MFCVWVSILKLPPGQHIGEAEEHEGGEGVSGFAAVEADNETATPTVVAVGGHVVVISFGLHRSTILIWWFWNPWFLRSS